MSDNDKSYAQSIGSILQAMIGHNRYLRDEIMTEKIQGLWAQVAQGDLAKHTAVIECKHSILLVDTTSSVLAQQIQFFKNMIMDKLKMLAPEIRIVDIKTRSSGAIVTNQTLQKKELREMPVPNEIEQSVIEEIVDLEDQQRFKRLLKHAYSFEQQDTRKPCPFCGNRHEASGEICPACASDHLQGHDVDIMNYLAEAPWSRYSDIVQDHKQIDELRYHLIKNKLINKTYDKLFMLYYEYAKTKQKNLLDQMKKNVLVYCLLKTGLTPDKLNDKIIENQINSKIYTVLYGKNS